MLESLEGNIEDLFQRHQLEVADVRRGFHIAAHFPQSLLKLLLRSVISYGRGNALGPISEPESGVELWRDIPSHRDLKKLVSALALMADVMLISPQASQGDFLSSAKKKRLIPTGGDESIEWLAGTVREISSEAPAFIGPKRLHATINTTIDCTIYYDQTTLRPFYGYIYNPKISWGPLIATSARELELAELREVLGETYQVLTKMDSNAWPVPPSNPLRRAMEAAKNLPRRDDIKERLPQTPSGTVRFPAAPPPLPYVGPKVPPNESSTSPAKQRNQVKGP